LAWKTDQFLSTGRKESIRDAAFGFEYLTVDNHQLGFGWLVTQAESETAGSLTDWQALTASWSKTYWNDDLTLSLLGNWREHDRQSAATVQAQLKLDDFWELSTALGYRERGRFANPFVVFGMPEERSGWRID